MLYALFAVIGIFVASKFLFTVFFPITSMKIRLAFLVQALTRLSEQQVAHVDKTQRVSSRRRS